MKPVLTHLAAAAIGGAIILFGVRNGNTDSLDPNDGAERKAGPDRRATQMTPSRQSAASLPAQAASEIGLDESDPDSFEELLDHLGAVPPSREELMDYIASRNNDSEAVFAAGLLLGDVELLRKAAASNPAAPHFALALAARDDVPIEERLAMTQRLLEVAPDNAMGSGLLAFLHFEAGDPESGLATLRQAVAQPSFDDYSRERVLATQEAMRATGSTPEGARLWATTTLEISHLFNLLRIAPHLKLDDPELPAVEREERRNLLAHIGADLAANPPGNNLTTELVGLAIQQRAHEDLPDNAPSAFEGLTVAEARAGIAERRNEIRANQGPDESQLVALPTEIRSSYLNRAFLLGEYEANVWLRQQPEFASQLPSAK